MSGYGQPPPAQQQQYAQQPFASGPPSQQPYHAQPALDPYQPPPQQHSAAPLQQPYGGPPAGGYNSYAPPDAAPGSSVPLGPPPGVMPHGGMQHGGMPPGGGAMPGAGMKRSFEETGGGAASPDPKRQEGLRGPPETVLRLLVPVRRVGAIIGKHGVVIKEIKEATGCRMRIIEAVPGADERVVVISSPDDPSQDRISAELGLFEVHRRVIEGEEPIPAAPGQPQGILTRMLVCHSQAGSIIGKSGVQIKEIRDISGSHIKILPPDELPPCALSNDRVVQMVGQPLALAKALGECSKIIRANPPKEKPGGCPPSLSRITGLPPGPQAGGLAARAHGPPMGGGGGGGYVPPGGGGPAGPGVVTKNVMVPNDQVGSIIGGQGSNINRIRQTSGARIKVHDPDPSNPAHRVVECTGTLEQIAAAESLLEPYQLAAGTGVAPSMY